SRRRLDRGGTDGFHEVPNPRRSACSRRAADCSCALVYALHSMTAERSRGVGTWSVVAHSQLKPGIGEGQLNVHGSAGRMPPRVGDGLLNDPVGDELDIPIEPSGLGAKDEQGGRY